jgi:uncharacterized protein YfkK (UPF0435 family)
MRVVDLLENENEDEVDLPIIFDIIKKKVEAGVKVVMADGSAFLPVLEIRLGRNQVRPRVYLNLREPGGSGAGAWFTVEALKDWKLTKARGRFILTTGMVTESLLETLKLDDEDLPIIYDLIRSKLAAGLEVRIHQYSRRADPKIVTRLTYAPAFPGADNWCVCLDTETEIPGEEPIRDGLAVGPEDLKRWKLFKVSSHWELKT